MSSFVDEIVKRQLKLKANPTAADFTAALGAANDLIKSVYAVAAPVDTLNPLFDKTEATLHPDQYKLGAVLGAYSQLIADYLARCGGDRHEVLRALLADIGDKVFDGKTIDATGAIQTVQYTCGGTAVNLPVGAGTADVVTALTEFAGTVQGQAMDLNGNRTVVDTVKANIVGGAAAPAAIKTLPSQGLIAIDTIQNVGYVPIYTKDASGNGQIAVVDLTVGVANPIITVVSLPGTPTPIASNFFADNGRVYVLAANGSNLTVHVDQDVGQHGRVQRRRDRTHLQRLVRRRDRRRQAQPRHRRRHQRDRPARHLDADAELARDVGDQRRRHRFVLAQLRDRPRLRLLRRRQEDRRHDGDADDAARLLANLGTTDGVAFDSLTGMMIITPEFQDLAYVINMNELPATAPARRRRCRSTASARRPRSAKAPVARSQSTC
jgi:hypothetical protein